jgi:hypothetical protein
VKELAEKCLPTVVLNEIDLAKLAPPVGTESRTNAAQFQGSAARLDQ